MENSTPIVPPPDTLESRNNSNWRTILKRYRYLQALGGLILVITFVLPEWVYGTSTYTYKPVNDLVRYRLAFLKDPPMLLEFITLITPYLFGLYVFITGVLARREINQVGNRFFKPLTIVTGILFPTIAVLIALILNRFRDQTNVWISVAISCACCIYWLLSLRASRGQELCLKVFLRLSICVYS